MYLMGTVSLIEKEVFFMKSFKLSLTLYAVTLFVSFFLTTSTDYNSFLWKLVIGQVFAIPVFLLSLLLCIVFREQPSLKEH